MILAWPLTISTELAGVLRPGGHLRADSALRSLRDKGLAAEPITVVPRSGRGADGRVVWYSSLMVDVARLVRAGDLGTAEAAHAAATELAGHRAARFVAEWLAEHGGPDPDPAEIDLGTGGALTRLATLTASARARLLSDLRIDTFAGRVADVSGRVAFVVDEEGRSLPLPAPSGAPMTWAGALVVVDTEELSGGATAVWVRPAFDPEADLNERVPGGPHLLTSAERERLSRRVAASR
ncbi:MAG TPA: hypothetical protein VNQ33_10380 [Acidimicrobiales bacterium]|nr:hypothetical protein [Acidimicrobiales bacterium]